MVTKMEEKRIFAMAGNCMSDKEIAKTMGMETKTIRLILYPRPRPILTQQCKKLQIDKRTYQCRVSKLSILNREQREYEKTKAEEFKKTVHAIVCMLLSFLVGFTVFHFREEFGGGSLCRPRTIHDEESKILTCKNVSFSEGFEANGLMDFTVIFPNPYGMHAKVSMNPIDDGERLVARGSELIWQGTYDLSKTKSFSETMVRFYHKKHPEDFFCHKQSTLECPSFALLLDDNIAKWRKIEKEQRNLIENLPADGRLCEPRTIHDEHSIVLTCSNVSIAEGFETNGLLDFSVTFPNPYGKHAMASKNATDDGERLVARGSELLWQGTYDLSKTNSFSMTIIRFYHMKRPDDQTCHKLSALKCPSFASLLEENIEKWQEIEKHQWTFLEDFPSFNGIELAMAGGMVFFFGLLFSIPHKNENLY